MLVVGAAQGDFDAKGLNEAIVKKKRLFTKGGSRLLDAEAKTAGGAVAALVEDHLNVIPASLQGIARTWAVLSFRDRQTFTIPSKIGWLSLRPANETDQRRWLIDGLPFLFSCLGCKHARWAEMTRAPVFSTKKRTPPLYTSLTVIALAVT